MQKRERCPVCFCPELQPFKKGSLALENLTPEKIMITDAEYGLTWDLSRCRHCAFVFANPGPDPELLAQLYSEVKDPDYEVEATGRRRNFRRILRRLEKWAAEKGRLFDVGAATGLFLDEAQKSGWQVSGIEPSRWAREQARIKYGLSLHPGSLETFNPNQLVYDVVTLIDILEHTPNPRLIMEKVNGLLKTKGVLVIVTPDLNSLAARLAGRGWWHFRPGHLGYFNRRSLQHLLDLTGFVVLSWRRYSWSFSLDYLLRRRPFLSPFLKLPGLASFWSRIPIKLALGDSFEVYAQKKEKT
jgi:SAM-dependent methyltransferase